MVLDISEAFTKVRSKARKCLKNIYLLNINVGPTRIAIGSTVESIFEENYFFSDGIKRLKPFFIKYTQFKISFYAKI